MSRFIAIATVALAMVGLAVPGGPVRAAVSGGDVADAVWGQPNFAANACPHHLSPRTLCAPSQVAVDAQGNLWVADFDNNRVLMYPPGSETAGKVFGQYGSFRTRGCNQRPPKGSHYPTGPSRYTLCQPFGVAVDSRGTLYVADSIDNRVLVYFDAAHKRGDAPADLVLGQATFSSTGVNDVPAGGHGQFTCPAPRPASRCTLHGPLELSVDPHDDLVVPDIENNRVLVWSAATLAHFGSSACNTRCFIPASQVWGQYGSFQTTALNNPNIPAGASPRCSPIDDFLPANACSLSGPSAAVADGQGDLFVADNSNNRVLEYAGALLNGRQDATAVYGQMGSFTTRFGNNLEGVSATALWHPLGLALDQQGSLWVTDFRNMRVLHFPSPGSLDPTTPIGVLGQEGSFTRNACGTGAGGLCGPTSIAFDRADHAFISDGFNSRVLEYFAAKGSGS